MARIGKNYFRIDGKNTEFPIWYTQKHKFHIKDLPNEILTICGIDKKDISGFDDEKSLVVAIQANIDLYHERKKSQRKVILLGLSATTAITRKNNRGCYGEPKYSYFQNAGYMGGEGYGFEIDFNVAIEVTDGSASRGKKYHEIKENGELGYQTSIPDSYLIIDWTEEREAALAGICASVDQLVNKVFKIMNDKKKVVDFLDSGKKLIR